MTVDELKCDLNFSNIALYKARDYASIHGTSSNRYISIIEDHLDDVVERTFAYHNTTRKGIQVMEVQRRTINYCIRRNIYLTPIGGYHPVYEPKTVSSGNYYGYYSYYFDATSDWNKWYQDNPMGICKTVIDWKCIFDIPKYKYCGYSGAEDLLNYLEAYEKDKYVEYFGKMGLRVRKQLMNLAKKDKQFVRWLRQQDPKEVNLYGPQITIYSYKHNVSFSKAEDILQIKRDAERTTRGFDGIKESGIDRVKLYEWIADNVGNAHCYRDYWNACVGLGLNMLDTKNSFPKDFWRMHDMRIAEYDAMKEKMEEKAKKKLYAKFRKMAAVLKEYEFAYGDYVIVIPTSVSDLKREGKALSHCVGRMGYDKKMADGVSFIAFVRKANEVGVPFVTVEYDNKSNSVRQCYKEHDRKPDQDVIDFVDRWAAVVKKKRKVMGL